VDTQHEHTDFGYVIDKEDAKEVLVERIRNFMNENYDMTIRELSKSTGLSESYINKLFAKDVFASMNSIYKLAFGLKVHPLQLLNGIERHIKPKGVVIDKDAEIDELTRNFYQKKVESEFKAAESKLLAMKEAAVSSMLPSELKSINIKDDSMNAAGILNGAILYYDDEKKEVENGDIYVIKPKFLNDKIVRQLWKVEIDDKCKYLLIPCTTHRLKYPIEEFKEEEFDVLGKVDNIALKF
jgi:SOS-response transcriptional repressor LexA